MTVGPLLLREFQTTARRGSTFWDRAGAAATVLTILGASAWAWDYWGLDWASVAEVRQFTLRTFACVVAFLIVLTMGVVPTEVARGLAGERDRKTLDALLATRLSDAEVVLGMTAAGLVKFVSAQAVVFPILALMVPLGGVGPGLLLLAYAGLASTAFALAGVGAVVSVGARSGVRSMSSAIGVSVAWFGLPLMVAIIFPRIFPGRLTWVVPVALWGLDSSPVGVVLNLGGVIRRAGPVESVFRMIGLQTAGGVLLFLWAIRRLRPASRALYDVESRALVLRLSRVTRRRSPCGDDPVFWKEKYDRRGVSDRQVFLGRLLLTALLAGFALGTYRLARPAFLELAARGYGASSRGVYSPEENPYARLFVNGLPAPPPGQARGEFNVVLRQAGATFLLFYLLFLAGVAAEGVAGERSRDTWTVLIATPLTGREILRAKMAGAIWRGRGWAALTVGLWALGLLSGAVHPFGFAAALAVLAVTGGFAVALGTYMSLKSRDQREANNRTLLPVMFLGLSGMALALLPAGAASVLAGSGCLPMIGLLSLLSYEDVQAALGPGTFPNLTAGGFHTGEGAGRVLAACLIGLTGHAVAAFLLTRAAFRGFDADVGRPVRAGA